MFKNMPEVSKDKSKPSQRNRLPWLLGLAGFLTVCLLAALVAAGVWYFTTGPGSGRTQPAITQPQPGSPPPAGVATGQPPPASTLPTPGSPSTAGFATARGKIAFSIDRGERPEDKYVWIMNADGSGAKQLFDRASSPALSPDGNLIAYYHWTDGIFVANTDGTNAHKILGETNAKYLTWSHDGKWLAFSSQPTFKGNVNIDAVLVDGSQRRTIIIGGSVPTWSPDDKEMAFHTCQASVCGIYKASTAGGGFTLVAGALATSPSWSPDGGKIVYHADADSVRQIFLVNPNGSGKKQLTTGATMHVDPQWSLDGASIYYSSPEGGRWGIWRMNADGTNPVRIAETGVPVDLAFERLAISK